MFFLSHCRANRCRNQNFFNNSFNYPLTKRCFNYILLLMNQGKWMIEKVITEKGHRSTQMLTDWMKDRPQRSGSIMSVHICVNLWPCCPVQGSARLRVWPVPWKTAFFRVTGSARTGVVAAKVGQGGSKSVKVSQSDMMRVPRSVTLPRIDHK